MWQHLIGALFGAIQPVSSPSKIFHWPSYIPTRDSRCTARRDRLRPGMVLPHVAQFPRSKLSKCLLTRSVRFETWLATLRSVSALLSNGICNIATIAPFVVYRTSIHKVTLSSVTVCIFAHCPLINESALELSVICAAIKLSHSLYFTKRYVLRFGIKTQCD